MLPTKAEAFKCFMFVHRKFVRISQVIIRFIILQSNEQNCRYFTYYIADLKYPKNEESVQYHKFMSREFGPTK